MTSPQPASPQFENRRRKGGMQSDLQRIPGVGPCLSADLEGLGHHTVESIRGANPEDLYEELCRQRGTRIDPCVLYVFRCAVYFATEPDPDPELLKWWSWKDRRLS